MQNKVTILGINGGFGQLFSKLLFAQKQLSVTGIDLSSKAAQSTQCSNYIQSDLSVEDAGIISTLRESDYILICLPEAVAYAFLESYKAEISATTLLVDTLSIKSTVAFIYSENNLKGLSLNPMFGPDLSTEGKNVVIVKYNTSAKVDDFISFLAPWKLNIVYLTADEHDKMTAMIQAATHAAIIAFGSTLKDFDIPLTELLKIGTPPFLTMSALFGRIVSGHKKVYWNIQNENSYASATRKALLGSLINLDKSIDNDDEQSFNWFLEPNSIEQRKHLESLATSFSSLPQIS